MKKLIPTLLPLLGLAITAVSPDVQGFIAHFVSAHPAYSSLITAASLIFNHWTPSPVALPSDSSVARAGTAVMLCFAIVLVPMGMTGCTYKQADVVKAVQKIETGLKTAQGLLPQGKVLLAELEQVDPGAVAEYTPFLDRAGTLLGKAIAAADTYTQNPGDDAYQALLNGVDAITAEADQELLASLKLVNPNSQIKVTGWIALVSTALHVSLAIAENYASSKQKKAVPAISAHVSFDQVRPFLNRQYAKQELKEMGYNADAAFAAVGF